MFNKKQKKNNIYNKTVNLVNKFKAFIIKIKKTIIIKESDTFIIKAKQVIKQKQAINIVKKLLNKTVTHALFKNNN